ncbi:bifunctional 2-polyprenyl-6-hydroxyphenol methylase/3-demethylubiquinol 3-O-methyltransferase UbiG [Belnapia sp. F-4-1]|uniref:class I SAM-dependent methyltransferase n=1 Tax=Belnapia sp. F-4-1 TaxID=1545443 RepID=UPI0005BAE588|nr:class I SAM-dependent methyltransferase [Belnapia sp. F-4-1]
MTNASILQEVGRYYAARLAEHGAAPRGVDWNGEESQRLRHAQFLRLVGGDGAASILDLGCGYGDFLSFLRSNGHEGVYHGWDIAPEMIEAARRLHGEGPDRQWHVGAVPDKSADFAIASGILNVKGEVGTDEWSSYVEQVLDVLAAAGRKGFGFNTLSLVSDPEKRRPNLHYISPVAMLDHCIHRYGRHVAILQDYGLWEFTVIVRHG